VKIGGNMDITLLRKAAFNSVLLMVSVILLSCVTDVFLLLNNTETDKMNIDRKLIVADRMLYAGYHKASARVLDYSLPFFDVSEDTGLTGVDAVKKQIDPEILDKLGNEFLLIEKPKGDRLVLSLENMYINKSIKLNITGMADNNISSGNIIRIRDNELFEGDPAYTESITYELDEEDQTFKEVLNRDYGKDLSHGITVDTIKDSGSGLYSANINITLDSVYEYFVYEDASNYYIDLRKPSEIFDKIVVIDAGHGGKDGGAVSKDENYCEKDINLDILLKLKKLLDMSDIKAYYTRTEDQTVYLRQRSELVNAVEADYFISIHINANENTSPNGMEVLYYDNEYKGVKSQDLARIFSEELGKMVNLRQKGIVKRNLEDIFIMDLSLVPTVLLEIGYISNKKDLAYLIREENRQLIADAIFNGIIRAYDELPVAD